MKFFKNILNRVTIHWQSTLIGGVIIVLTIMYYNLKISTQDYVLTLGSIVGLRSVLMSKDPDKVQTKPEVKGREQQ